MSDLEILTELTTYKNKLIAQLTNNQNQIIAQLTNNKNQIITQLNAQYTPILRYIRYMKSSTHVKHDYNQYIRDKCYESLKSTRDKYNQRVHVQNKKFQNELQKINLLTDIPYDHYIRNKCYESLKSTRHKYNHNQRVHMQNELQEINLLTDIPGRRNPEKFALIVGINYVNTNYALDGCINDANKIKQFIDAYAYKTNNIVLLTDETEDKPTKHNIIKSFKNLLLNAVSGDTLVFMYSGHGTYTTDINGDELDGFDEMIIPIDATNPQSCIIDDEFKTIIDAYLKSGVKLFILMDCCFSGTILDLKYNYIDDNNFDKTTVNAKSNETNGAVIVFSASTDNQTGVELIITENGTPTYGGALTLSFLQCISEKGDAISIQQLLEGMREILTDKKCKQTIQISSGNLVDISKLMLTDVL